MEDLAKNYRNAYDMGMKIKAIVVINPGNPTGQVMTKSNLEDVKNILTKTCRLLNSAMSIN